MSKFYLKPAVLAVMMVLLSACQTTTTNNTPQDLPKMGVIPDTARVLFTETDPSAVAKAELIKAVSEHLAKERHTVSTHYSQVLPLYGDDSPNKTADPFWGSVVKVREYQRNLEDISEQPYMTESEYLDEYLGQLDDDETVAKAVVDLPYLRYNDQNHAQAIGRDWAMTAELYKETDRQISEFIDAVNGAVSSLDDDFLLATSTVSDKNKEGKEILKKLTDLQKDYDSQRKTLLKSAQGYQIQDLNDTMSCVVDYGTGVKDLLSKSISVQDKQATNLLYQNYSVCVSSYGLNKTLTPATYIAEGYTENHLKATSKLLTCQQTAVQEQRALRASGRTYANDEQAYLDSYVNFAKCSSDILWTDSDEINDFESAKSTLYPIRQVRDYGKLAEYYTSVDKYDNFSGWLQAYRDMKASGKTDDTKSDDELPALGRFGIYGSMMTSMLDYIKQSPEQLVAKNLYQYNNTTITSLSHHNPATRQATMLWSLDFESPTARQSAQLPVQADFGAGVVNADVSALLPLVAVVAPKYAPMPDDVPNGLMYFKAPSELAQKIPSHIIYDAVSRGVVVAMGELNAQSFTPVAGMDDFAKQTKATKTIKLTLSTKEMGQMYATIAKSVVKDLDAYVDANPQIYPDTIATKHNKSQGIKKGQHTADSVKKAIKDFATLSDAHRSSDVGGILQVVEGVLPFGIDTASYLYLGADGRLLGSQSVVELQDELHDYRLKSVTQTYHDKAVFDNHALSAKFYSSFREPAKVDGVAWIKSSYDDYRFTNLAKSARQNYDETDTSEHDDTSQTVPSNACTERADIIAQSDDDSVRQMAEAFKQKECPTR